MFSRKIITSLVLFFSFFHISFSEVGFDLVKCIHKVFPEAVVEKLEARDHFTESYQIMIKQWLDHNNHAAGTFQQKLYLSHVKRRAPMVYVTEGYSARNRTSEIATMLKGNQLVVEYRFTGDSKPLVNDWKYLTSYQATEDLHRIRMAFGKIYKKVWVGTGISKGGSTTLIYKAKYPKDVKVAIPYVAPLAIAQEDKRTDEHILSVGPESCRQKLHDFQIEALKRRDRIIPMIEAYAIKNKSTFMKVGIPSAFEFAVLEFTFSFWQWGHDCKKVPGPDATDEEYFNYLNTVVSFDFYNDATCDYFLPSFYQFLTELGYYGFIKDHVSDLLIHQRDASNLTFGPKDANLSYDGTYVKNVLNWLDENGDNIIYIYGALDPWTACGVYPSSKVDALRFDVEHGSHMSRIINLSDEDQALLYKKLKKWLKRKVHPLNSKP